MMQPSKMQILFHCRHCFGRMPSQSVERQRTDFLPALQETAGLAIWRSRIGKEIWWMSCAVCQQQDFYIRDEARKAWGLLFLLLGLAAAYWTYGMSLLLGGYGFYLALCQVSQAHGLLPLLCEV